MEIIEEGKEIQEENIWDKPTTNKDNGGKSGIVIICVLVACLVALVAALIVAYFMYWGNDKYQLAEAVKKLCKDQNAYSEAIMPAEAREELATSLCAGKSKLKYSFNVAGIEELPVTLGLDGTTHCLVDEEKITSDNKLSIMNIDIARLIIHVDDTDLYVRIPELFDECFKLNTTTISDDFNSSILAQYVGITLPDNIDFDVFENKISGEVKVLTFEEFAGLYSDDLKAMYKAIEVSHAKEKADFVADNGEHHSCKVYQVRLPKEETNRLYHDYLEALAIEIPENAYIMPDKYSLAEDALLQIFVDEDGYIREIASVEEVDLTEFSIVFDTSFVGSEVETDGITLRADYRDASDNFSIDANLNQDIDGARNISLETRGTIQIGCQLEQKSKYDSASKCLKSEIDRLEIDTDGKELFHLSGDCELSVLEESKFEYPEGKIVDVMHMTLTDILSLALEVNNKTKYIRDMSDMLGGIF